jgi:hypothetical protein
MAVQFDTLMAGRLVKVFLTNDATAKCTKRKIRSQVNSS